MKKVKLEKGITLIALIITIIILLILAVVTIGSIKNNNIVSYAQNAATTYKQDKSEEETVILGYEALIEESISEKKEDGIVHEGVIPERATYTTAEGTVYNAGQNFPATVTAGDVYAFGDYEYKYNYIWGVVDWLEYTSIDNCVEGWGVRVVDRTKSEYGTVITKINEKNITNMVYTFDNCKELLIAPAIPSGVTTIYSAFTYCTKLTTMPDMNKASNLINMEETFYDCVALKNVTKIPNSVTNMDYTFIGCTALETVPAIPNSVEKMNYTFTKCAALTGEIEINANPTSYYNCFNGTGKNIKITGSSTAETKAALASTSSGNVTY